jgi:hypothetical protein
MNCDEAHLDPVEHVAKRPAFRMVVKSEVGLAFREESLLGFGHGSMAIQANLMRFCEPMIADNVCSWCSLDMKGKEGKDDMKFVVSATQSLLNTTSFSRSLRLSIPALPELTIPRFNGFITTSPYRLCDM